MYNSQTVAKLQQIGAALLTLLGSCVMLYLLWYHYTLVTFPWPVQYREGGLLLSTELLLKGGNPYDLAVQPYYANAYGIVYNYIVLPFAAVWGPTLLVHKAVAGAFTLLSLVLTAILLRREKIPLRYILATIALLYSCLLYNKTSLAEPDSTGLFVYMLSIAIPLLLNCRLYSLIVGAVLVAIAFCVKPYFFLGAIAVVIYLLINKMFKELLVYVISLLVAFMAMALILYNTLDAYYVNVLLANYNYGRLNSSWKRTFDQLAFIFNRDKFYFWVSIPAIALLAKQRRSITASGNTAHYLSVVVIVQCVVFLLLLSKNTGAWGTYFYQLILPFFAVLAAISFKRIQRISIVLAVDILLLMAIAVIPGQYPSLSQKFGNNGVQWEKARQLIRTHRNILNSPAIAPLLIEYGRPVYDTGHTSAFVYGLVRPELIEKSKLEKLRGLKNSYFENISQGIGNRTFDLIMVDRSFSQWLLPPNRLSDYYEHKGELSLYCPHLGTVYIVDIWEPLTKARSLSGKI